MSRVLRMLSHMGWCAAQSSLAHCLLQWTIASQRHQYGSLSPGGGGDLHLEQRRCTAELCWLAVAVEARIASGGTSSSASRTSWRTEYTIVLRSHSCVNEREQTGLDICEVVASCLSQPRDNVLGSCCSAREGGGDLTECYSHIDTLKRRKKNLPQETPKILKQIGIRKLLGINPPAPFGWSTTNWCKHAASNLTLYNVE
jgi:hypothetical protein